MSNKKVLRYEWVDVLRGIAIILMIPANFAANLHAPHPMLFRLVSSLAAPVFITLCAGMVVLNSEKHSFIYYLTRGFYILIIAAALDLLQSAVPFYFFDVLYLIGFSLPIAYLLRNLSCKTQISLVFFLFLLSVILRDVFGYTYFENNLIVDALNPHWIGLKKILFSFLLNGIFPIFPWLGFTILGTALFKYLFAKKGQQIPFNMLILALGAFILGIIALYSSNKWMLDYINGGVLIQKMRAVELFFPAAPAFLCIASSAIIILIKLTQKLTDYSWSSIIAKFGQYSLFVYIVHTLINFYLIEKPLENSSPDQIENRFIFSLIIIAVYISIYFMLIGLEKLKAKYRPTSAFIQLLIGH